MKFFSDIQKRILELLHRESVARRVVPVEGKEEESLYWRNPYLSLFREILEQVLIQKGITYQEFRPVILDRALEETDQWGEGSYYTRVQIEEMDEDIKTILGAIEKDLNYLRILTDRPEYFSRFAGTMYEENGLIVGIESKERAVFDKEEVLLDAEQGNRNRPKDWTRAKAYLPIWKKRWETVGNLDISVPIGYNTLIVKAGYLPENETKYLPDRK